MRGDKRTIVGAIVAACLLAAGAVGARSVLGDPTPMPDPGFLADAPYDYCRRPCQQKRATDVFVGRVVTRVPGAPSVESDLYDTRYTVTVQTVLYTVDVTQVIRGEAAGNVVVFQSRNFDRLPTEGASLLEAGEVAIFVTTWDGGKGRYSLIDGKLGYQRLPAGEAAATVEAGLVAQFGAPTPSTRPSGTPVSGGTPLAQP